MAPHGGQGPWRPLDLPPETLDQYAAKCDAATGTTVPDFNCDDGTLVPTTNFQDGKCDRPNRLNQVCDPGSHFQVLTRTSMAFVVAHCRKKGNADGRYGDIAVIQHNMQTGDTCFYQALNPGLDGHVKAPSKGTGAYPWLSPWQTASTNCAGCHDNGPLIRSPYLAQVTGPNALPGAGDTAFNRDQPYRFVGNDFASWRVYKVTRDGNLCNNCHRLGVNNVAPRGGTALDFALRATAPEEKSKNPHGPLSPIWMTPGAITWNQTNDDAAHAIAECGHAFQVQATLPDGCHVASYGDPSVHMPTVTFVFPSYGPPDGGTPVRISGTNFAVGNTQITVGGRVASAVNCTDSTTCYFTTPPGDGVSSIIVTSNGTMSASSTDGRFYYVPSITKIDPAAGQPDDLVTIHGIGFSATAGGTTIMFGSSPAISVSCWPGPDCTVLAPPGAGTVDVRVTVNGTTSKVTPWDRFTYSPSTITSIDTTSGSIAGGTYINIFGHGFDPALGGMKVFFGGVQSDYVNCMSATWCYVRSPASAQYGPVHITFTAFGVTSPTTPADLFTYVPPALAAINWASPTGSVVLNGFAPAGGVTVGIMSSDPGAIVPPTSLSIPAGGSGATFGLTFLPIDHAETVTLIATMPGSSASMTVPAGAWPPLTLQVGAGVLALDASTTATISFATAAPAGGTRVAVTSSNSSAIPVPATVTVPAGAHQATFSITNHYAGRPQAVMITASSGSSSSSASVSVPTDIVCQPRKCPKGTVWDPSDCSCEVP
jgi:hypothetical protein